MARAPAQISRRALTDAEQDQANRFKVEAMAACGATPKDIATYLNLTKKEVEERYGTEIKHGLTNLKLSLEIMVAGKAKSGDTRCLLAWLNQYGGWSKVTKKDLNDGERPSLGKLDNLSLDRLIIVLRQAEAAPGGSEGSRIQEAAGGQGRIIDMEPIPGATDESSEE